MLKKIYEAGIRWLMPLNEIFPFFVISYILVAAFLCFLTFQWWYILWVPFCFFVISPATIHLSDRFLS